MNLGGTEKALLSFIDSLADKGVSVTLVLLEEGGALFKEIPDWVSVEIISDFEKVKPIIYDPPLVLIKNSISQFKLASAIKHLARYVNIKITDRWYINYIEALKLISSSHEADIAIAYAGPSDFISYYIHKRVKANRKIQWIHFDVREMVFKTNFGEKYYQHFDDIFCVSKNAQLVFDKMFPKYANKTSVFKNIVSKNQLEKSAIIGDTYRDDFDGIRILTLGRLSKEKGQLMIPNVVKQLKEKGFNFRWYLIGDGQLYSELLEQIKKLEISTELILLGAKNNPYRFVKDCDVYVQSSYHEGYCLTVHEAKIFNRPVVVTKVASASNLITHNEDGLIVEISEEGIYNGVKRLLEEKLLREKFAQNILSQETVNEIDKLVVH